MASRKNAGDRLNPVDLTYRGLAERPKLETLVDKGLGELRPLVGRQHARVGMHDARAQVEPGALSDRRQLEQFGATRFYIFQVVLSGARLHHAARSIER